MTTTTTAKAEAIYDAVLSALLVTGDGDAVRWMQRNRAAVLHVIADEVAERVVFYPSDAILPRPVDAYGTPLSAVQAAVQALDRRRFRLTPDMFTPGSKELRDRGFAAFVKALAATGRVGVWLGEATENGVNGEHYRLVTEWPAGTPRSSMAFEHDGHWYGVEGAWATLYGKYAHAPRIGPWFAPVAIATAEREAEEDVDEATQAQALTDVLDRAQKRGAERLRQVQDARAPGASVATLRRIVSAEIVAPVGPVRVRTRYGALSRGKCWGRLGTGRDVAWADKDRDHGVVLLDRPGVWTVGSDDGFRRNEKVPWTVEEVDVGGERWLIAN